MPSCPIWQDCIEVAKQPTAEMIAEGLTEPEHIMLLCIASGTDWQKVPGLTYLTARHLIVRKLIKRQSADSYALTDQGRAVLEALMMRAAARGD
jgi:hypothetical protein